MLEYKVHSVEELKLFLLREKIQNNKELTVIESGKFSTDKLSIHLRIIGQSHWIEFQTESGVFTEILACLENENPYGNSVWKYDSLRNFQIEKNIDLNWKYSCQTWIYETTSEKMNLMEKKLRSAEGNDEKIYLTAVYPKSQENPDSSFPLTVIECSRMNDGAVIDTLHLYPEDRKLVYSSSMIKYNK